VFEFYSWLEEGGIIESRTIKDLNEVIILEIALY
jgi:hypothetical protein